MNEFDRLAGSVIVGGFDGTELPDAVRERLARGALAGVTLFKRNVADAPQVARLCAQIAAAVPAGAPSPIVSVDQEGGRVKRFGSPVLQLPPMRVLGAIDDPELTRRAGRALGEDLSALGITVNFAPVADVDSNPANPVIGDRSFARDPARVGRHVAAFTEGMQSRGVGACAKHFPGHGDTEQDSHHTLPRVRHDRARLDAMELPPFRDAVRAGVASVMTAHVVYDALAPETPATLARAVVTDILRGELGFRGVCFSDDLHMSAVSALHPVERAAVLAIEAGCDALLVCTDPDSQERCRLALAARAAGDPAFAARLREAAGRVDALRREFPARPVVDERGLMDVLASPEHAAVRAEIDARAQSLGVGPAGTLHDPTAR